MSSQVLILFVALVVFSAIGVAEVSKSIHQKIRLNRDKSTSSVRQGEESTWNELTEHHRPVTSTGLSGFSAGPHERLAAISAPYALCYQDPWDNLSCSDPEGKRNMFARDWAVHSRIDLLTQIYWLIMFGHRNDFDQERARWTDTSLAEAERYELKDAAKSSRDAAETLWRLERMRRNDRGIQNVDFVAWDMVRAAMLTRYGAALGWLTQAEAWDTLAVLDSALRDRYHSWTQVWEAFRLARWYWFSASGQEEHNNDLHDLNRSLVLLGKDGPWGVVPWDVAVPTPSLTILDELIDLGVAAPMSASEREHATHWQRLIDNQIALRGQRRSPHFGTHPEWSHRFTKQV